MGCLTTIKNHKYQHKNPFGMSDEKELDHLLPEAQYNDTKEHSH